MDDHLVCYGCGLVFESSDTNWVESGDDMAASCPDCGSEDVVTYETYLEEVDS